VVTINAPDDWHDHKILLDTGFSDYSVQQVVSDGQSMGIVEIAGGQSGSVELLAAEPFSYALAEGEEPTVYIPGCGFLYAPVVEGTDAGYAFVLLNEKCIGKIRLVYGSTVEMEQEEHISWFKRLFGGRKK
jgi:D-alanyl-D-alanine carboxypeptidase